MSQMGRSSLLDQRYAELDLLRPAEAARRLGIDPQLLAKYARAGQIPSVSFDWGNLSKAKHGYRSADIEDLIERMRQVQ